MPAADHGDVRSLSRRILVKPEAESPRVLPVLPSHGPNSLFRSIYPAALRRRSPRSAQVVWTAFQTATPVAIQLRAGGRGPMRLSTMSATSPVDGWRWVGHS